jgi:orotate phosphoribosyltransferase-like protein
MLRVRIQALFRKTFFRRVLTSKVIRVVYLIKLKFIVHIMMGTPVFSRHCPLIIKYHNVKQIKNIPIHAMVRISSSGMI